MKTYGSVTYEGQTYKTVVIGTQTWMAENLNYNVNGSSCYDNSEANCTTYGRLYNWATAMALPSSCNSSSCSSQISTKHRGICPSGWHIPSTTDQNVLGKFVNPSCSDFSGCKNAGTKLKATNGWNSYSEIPFGTDDYGFAALPGGIGYSNGSFDAVGNSSAWWQSEQKDANNAHSWVIYHRYESTIRGSYDKSYYLFSVRCLQN